MSADSRCARKAPGVVVRRLTAEEADARRDALYNRKGEQQ